MEALDWAKMPKSTRSLSNVDEALATLCDVVKQQAAGDQAYFDGQFERYRYSVTRILELFPRRCRVLDIGSHYLHQASLLSMLGYEVSGIDVPLFADAQFVRDRANAFGIHNYAVDGLEKGTFLQNQSDAFDLVIFTEIIEHITFNPVSCWRRLYELLAENGMIYLTTPNALRPGAYLRALGRLLAFRGIGLPVKEVLGTVTYGHHWKEYSISELRNYFQMLSPDFEIQSRAYFLRSAPGVKGTLMRVLGAIPAMRSDIEVIARLAKKRSFSARPPQLAMTCK